jgi:hypothetical protein
MKLWLSQVLNEDDETGNSKRHFNLLSSVFLLPDYSFSWAHCAKSYLFLIAIGDNLLPFFFVIVEDLETKMRAGWRKAVPEESLKLMLHLNALDIRLYWFADKLLDARISKLQGTDAA